MISKKIISIISLFILHCITFIPCNLILGSHGTWFTYAAIALPALAYQQSLLYVIFYFFTKSLFLYSLSPFYFLYRFPTFVASLAMRQSNYAIAIIIPIIAMILFCIHPIGSQVFYYSWFWFVPMIVYWCCQDSLYTRAFIASFVAHATGSVIWLYTKNLAPEIWNSLMIIVPFERLFIALGIIGCTLIVEKIEQLYEHKVVA